MYAQQDKYAATPIYSKKREIINSAFLAYQVRTPRYIIALAHTRPHCIGSVNEKPQLFSHPPRNSHYTPLSESSPSILTPAPIRSNALSPIPPENPIVIIASSPSPINIYKTN